MFLKVSRRYCLIKDNHVKIIGMIPKKAKHNKEIITKQIYIVKVYS